jgi:cell division septation protein DedD
MGMWETFIQSAPSVPVQTLDPTTAEYAANVAVQEQTEFNYYIIGGSFKSEENAGKYLQQLKEQGYNGQNLGVFKGLHRIAMKGFVTIEDAQKELNKLLYQNPQSGVWISANE